CGCVGKPGGGWAHYVGQEKLRPQPGWIPLAFGLDWYRPSRQMNATSFFYAHTDQWRYERLPVSEILSPTVEEGDWSGSMIDYNVRAERMGWLPSAPQLNKNSLAVGRDAKASGMAPGEYIAAKLKSGELKMACEDPDAPENWPRNFFVWRGNLLGSSGKGHEYFLKHLLGAQNGVLGKDIGERGAELPKEVVWHPKAPQGKVDLWVNIEFRMTSTGLYSDVILPTATWYEKNDINTTDMHPFVHPLSAAVDPVWETRSDWDIFRGLAKKFSEVAEGQLGTETDIMLQPLMHDSPSELGQALDVKEWKKGECEPIPGKTMPQVIAVERHYPDTYKKFTAFGPLLDTLGNNSKGIVWNTETEIELLREVNGVITEEGIAQGRPRIVTDLNAIETILLLSPETNGHVAVKSWEALEKSTGRHHAHLAAAREDEKIRYHDVVAQPRKIITSPTWSGIESEKVSYNAGYTNVHELIPWRTLTGRQQFYQDHKWMRAFGEELCVYKPPVSTRTLADVMDLKPNGNKAIPLNFITPHQKWSIHSTHTDNLIMLTLNRGGPCIWINEEDAKSVGIEDNDWVEGYNVNGALTARAVVSQRLPRGMVLMYHAQEKHVNTPGSEVTGIRGGIHNSITRIMIKPTHMIGGYMQQSYGFNYYGTTGVQRDEFLLVRKMNKIDWMDGPLVAAK
ncbi:MAG: nitrate reductase subunit alpha, partial [Rhodospirillaceae bacterium]